MLNYEIKDILGDYALMENGECKLILNSYTNAEYIRAILRCDSSVPNAATLYVPEIDKISDGEALAIFRLCSSKDKDNCSNCPLCLVDECRVKLNERMLSLFEHTLGEHSTGVNYCRFCFNSRVYEPTEEEMMDPFYNELTDENDLHDIGVGRSANGYRIGLVSGAGKPMRIEFWAYNAHSEMNTVVAKYSPKFCPECGRALTEYNERGKEHENY